MPSARAQALGICLGASSIGLVRLAANGAENAVADFRNIPHGGDPVSALGRLLADIPQWRLIPTALTGRKLAGLTRLPSISEPEAVELAVPFVLGKDHGDVTVLSAGGETFMAYHVDACNRVRAIQSGNKCASGTGEFFRQQLGRMGLTVEDLPGMDLGALAHPVSGRCSVFCKSDCTHSLNKGVPKASVVAGLGSMMADKCLELLQTLPRQTVLLTGGCCANPFLLRFLGEKLPGLAVPPQAGCFEALGAALWVMRHRPQPPGEGPVITGRRESFAKLPPLADALALVEFKTGHRGTAQDGDEAVLGLDVGSTTTKGVLLRRSDNAVLAGEYLRTQGDPVAASRTVYARLADQIRARIRITGLGVTGSGRAIAALHANATAAVNEIIAHARAAAHYDPQVDTIFEIGGQDAKYTFLSGGHPCDSAMNEACSAGTGSFLEEAARECLGVAVEDMADLALEALATPNFNDQCSAFIGSDIALASQEGLSTPEILAGLTRSVCLNYVSRVKGPRPVGGRVFMQGGVCYNRAVPAAMAMLTGRPIVVPPEPGLMGAVGVALEISQRMANGVCAPGDFDLAALAALRATQRKPFICRGGRGGRADCDRGCEVARIEVGGKVHPFGGACNRFENLRAGAHPNAALLDVAQARHRRIFQADQDTPASGRLRMGINRSYLVNTYFPFYAAFFEELGWDVVLPRHALPEATRRTGAALCYPAELAHGFLGDLLARRPDALFLPHVPALPATPDNNGPSCTCVLLQGEPFYLRAAFEALREGGPAVFAPTLDFSRGLEGARGEMVRLACELGAHSHLARQAFSAGLAAQESCRADLARMGREALAWLAGHPETTGVVLFGRSYNAFAPEANKGVPEKLATRGAMAIPCDMLPLGHATAGDGHVYWGQGRVILNAARVVKSAPQLSGAYITNFSCGPDSFLISYFRDIMGDKPSLTLELDSHTAGAGLETRLEAFLDIAGIHRRTARASAPDRADPKARFSRQARMEIRRKRPGVLDSQGVWHPLHAESVRILLPSMNAYGNRFSAAALTGCGYRAHALSAADSRALALGRANSSCKECLPLQLTVGSLLTYLETRDQGEVSVYFMPGAQGPCRFGQYGEFTSRLLEKKRIPDVAVLSPLSETGYGGLPAGFTLGIWRGIVLGDVFEEMRSGFLALAVEPEKALEALEDAAQRAQRALLLPWSQALAAMRRLARELAGVALKQPLAQAACVALLGEIYVRHDAISRQGLVRRLAAKGIVAKVAPVSEWVFYTDWLQNQGIINKSSYKDRFKQWFKRRSYTQIRQAFVPSGLIRPHAAGTPAVVGAGGRFISPRLTGEAILTVGAAIEEILDPVCGVIALGPFGCMPNRLAEAVLQQNFTTRELAAISQERFEALPADIAGPLPFLALETDGAPFPQLLEARFEAFCLQALRLHGAMNQ